MSAKIFSSIVILLCITSLNHALTRISGNAQTRNGDTFSFGIKPMYTTADQRMIVAAHESGAQNFALCSLESGATQFRPLAHETIIHNGQKEQKNPLYDAAIAHIAPLNNTNIAIVKADDLTHVYSHNFAMFKNHLFSTKPIMDATGTYPTSGITALAAGNGYAFVAVKGHDQEHFGAGDSGIALIKFSEVESEQELDAKAIEKIKEEGKDLSDAEKEEIQKAVFQDKDGKTKKRVTTFGFTQINTAPLNNTCNILKIGDADITIEEVTDMYYSPALERVYIACKVSVSQKQKSVIIVGRVNEQGMLQLVPLIDLELQKDGNIGVNGIIHRVKTLQTSTGYLDYLIILVDIGLGQCTEVNALPLLNLKRLDGTIVPTDSALHGTLAHKNSSLIEGYGPNNSKTGRSTFLGRHFNQKPTETTDVNNLYYGLLNTDAMCVGGNVGCAMKGIYSHDDIFVQGDCVYAIRNNNKFSSDNCVVQSQAIFGHDGRIQGWTLWKNIYNAVEYVASYMIDGASGNAIISDGADAVNVRSLKRTGWNTESQDTFVQMITQEFSKENGGIQGLFDFSHPSCALASGIYHCCSSLLCITGKAKTILAFFHSPYEDNTVHMVNGSELNELGSIIAAEKNYAGLWIGGSGGLAIAELNNFDPHNKHDNITFKKIGNFSFVKKLISDEHYLYVLTDTTFDRIDIEKSDFKNNQLAVTRLATADDLLGSKNSFFYDCIVSGPLALLAHNKGLSRIANDHDVRIDDGQSIAWTNIPLTSESQPCIALSAVSVTGQPCDVARYGAGQIYAVLGSKRERNSKVYRLAVTESETISDKTVVPFNDYVVKDLSPFYFNLRSYTPGFFTDGTLSFIAQNKKNKIPAHLVTHYGTLRNTTPITLNDASTITHMVRCSANGKWFVAGDFGLVVNE